MRPLTGLKVVSLKDMTELADGGLVRCGLTAKVYADKVAHGAVVVKRLLNRRVGEVEPVLKKMNAEHAFDSDRRASGTLGFGVEWLDDLTKLSLGNNPVHLGEKKLPAGRLAKTFKAAFGKSLLAHLIHLQAA